MPDNYFARYLPLLLHIVIVGGIAVAMVVLSQLVGKHRWTRAKMSPYECGIIPTGDARQRFSVKFYLVAMLFILFDIEAVFLYPWAVVYKELRLFGLVEAGVFLVILLLGLFYVLKKKVLDFEQ